MTYATWSPTTKRIALAILLVWAGLAYLIGRSGILVPAAPQVFQPVALTVIIPVLIFAAAYLALPAFRRFVLAQDLRWLTALLLWRVLGFTFLALYAFDVLPALFAWPAGFGDVAIGIGAAVIVARLAQNADFARTRAFATFHVLGLLDFVVAVVTSTLASGAFPALVTAPTAEPMALWPLNIFPSFIVPFFIMLHAAVFLQLAALRRADTVTANDAPHAAATTTR